MTPNESGIYSSGLKFGLPLRVQPMSEIDKMALEALFQNWKKERAPDESDNEAFERFTIEQILKDADLSDEDIDSGLFGGEDDGGVDAMYFFINRLLIQDETDVPDPALTAELVVIQAKRAKGFSETALDKIRLFTRDLLDFRKPAESLTHLNALARDCIGRFRATYEKILGSPHSLTVTFHYAIDGDTPPNTKIQLKANNLKNEVSAVLSAATVGVKFWECQKLLREARSGPTRQFTLKTTKLFATDDSRAVVCLVQLKELSAFLTDDNGAERRGILEPNVRAYQGSRNAVNTDIRKTLEATDDKDFWWFNNGITILATDHHFTGPKLVVERPQIVNGLQTSKEIFNYLKAGNRDDNRNVLIRVVVPPDEATRNRIIKATNFQTPVPLVSLHATDQLHFDIEDKLKLYGLYYDRRKGEHRDARRAISHIVSIPALAKAVIAILLQRPNDARARPGNLLKDEGAYKQIFNGDYNRNLYVACILIDRQVQEYLKNTSGQALGVRRDLQYYVAMMVACILAKKPSLTDDDVAALFPVVQTQISEPVLADAWGSAFSVYQRLGATDKVSKGVDLVEELRQNLNKRTWD